jgi:hypothetical protein
VSSPDQKLPLGPSNTGSAVWLSSGKEWYQNLDMMMNTSTVINLEMLKKNNKEEIDDDDDVMCVFFFVLFTY